MAPPLEVRSIPSGRYATPSTAVPTPGCRARLAAAPAEWLPSSGEQVGEGLSYEIYRNDPSNTPREDLLTEVYLLLAG
ncbi:MAG: GyrI-like domain-containing protein [Gemmatimonadales bacterium]